MGILNSKIGIQDQIKQYKKTVTKERDRLYSTRPFTKDIEDSWLEENGKLKAIENILKMFEE